MARAAALLAVAVCLAVAGPSPGQPPPPPPVPPPPGGSVPVLPAPVWVPGTAPAPGIPPAPPPPPPPPPVAIFPGQPQGMPADLVPCAPRECPPGWFSAIELGLVLPHVNYGLAAPVTVGGATTLVNVPAAGLDWTGSVSLELGYGFPDGYGAVLGTYRNVTSHGGGSIADFDPAGGAGVRSRLELDVLDVDYLGADLRLAPLWGLDWRLGLRLASFYTDTQAAGRIFNESSSDHFVGAGPHAGVEVRRTFPELPGLAVFGSLQLAVVIGESSENFQATERFADGTSSFGDSRVSGGRSVPVLDFRTGVSYAPPQVGSWFRFALGYEVEEWWGVGNVGGNHTDLNVQGLFFRGEFRY